MLYVTIREAPGFFNICPKWEEARREVVSLK